MIKSQKLSKFKKIKHGFFNRNNGYSKGIYKSLNCGPGSKDKKNNIEKNLKIVKEKIGKNSKKIFLLHQIHSNNFIYINENFKFREKKIKADAIITNQKNIPIAVLTADCVPLLMYDNKKNAIAAVHAGWKGAFKGIIKKVINFMVKLGSKKSNITVAIGPCISQKNYEVKEDFKKKFLKKDKKNKIFFKKIKNSIYFNLPNYVKYQLKYNKIKSVDLLNVDTFVSILSRLAYHLVYIL